MTEVGLWHARQGQVPMRLMQRALPSEKDLEAWIESDPSLIAPGVVGKSKMTGVVTEQSGS